MSASEEDLFNLDDLEEIIFPPEVQKAIDQVSLTILFHISLNSEYDTEYLNFRYCLAKILLISLILILWII